MIFPVWCAAFLAGCAPPNIFDIPALKPTEMSRRECIGKMSPSQAWDSTTSQCVQLTAEQTAERQRQAAIAWDKEVEAGRAQQAEFGRRYPAAAACMRYYAGRFVQSRSGQLMEMCLMITRQDDK